KTESPRQACSFLSRFARSIRGPRRGGPRELHFSAQAVYHRNGPKGALRAGCLLSLDPFSSLRKRARLTSPTADPYSSMFAEPESQGWRRELLSIPPTEHFD